ncbi:putative myb transcription [Rosellinia necatrix]|uniref:Putative myb transcription n=1 Tax=Rosellinia necatrix TaxID=77044 RepID=A0A1W2TQF7_ROSNE|nr:putative myb transcription [Rosellinia necatrix]
MGQTASQTQEEGYDSKDDTLEQDQFRNHEHSSDEPVFSSQIHNAGNSALLPPRRPAKIKYTSSSRSRFDSAQALSPVSSRKMSNSSPYSSSPVPSSIDFSIQAEVDGKLPHPSDKKAESKRRKRERRESRRAAKLAERQAAASATLELADEPSRFAEIWDAHEAVLAAKREQEEEEPEPPVGEPVGGVVESRNTTSKKRRRESRIQVEDGPQRKSKKRKNPQNDTTSIATEHNEPSYGYTIEEPEVSGNSEINFNELAEHFYSGRKRKSQADAAEAGSETVEPRDSLDINGRSGIDLAGNGPVGTEVDGQAETYGDDFSDNGVSGMAWGTLSAAHVITGLQATASATSANEPIRDNHPSEPVLPGVIVGEETNHEAQDGMDVDGRAAPNHIGEVTDDDIEVPSSLPLPRSNGEPGAQGRATNTTSTGSKRVAKQDFFSRMADNYDESISSQSPSAAALSHKSGKGKRIAVSEGDNIAGPSTANGKSVPPKVKDMLNSPGGERAPITPSTESMVRVREIKTPVTLSGAFSELEIQNLTEAIERFRDDHKMIQHHVNELIHSNPKESRAGELWECIMAACPGRSRQKVINQTRRKFHNFVARGTWTAEQDQELREMFERYGNKYSLIGQLINRHPEDIRDRVRNYIICGDKLRKDVWSQEETDRLVTIVEQAIEEIRSQRAKLGQDNIRPVEDDINWQMVSQGMERTRSRLQCIAKWKAIKPHLAGGGLDGDAAPVEEIIQQARETATTMSYRNRSFVIKGILKSGANADSRIPWLKVRTELGNQWTRPPLMIVWFRLRRTIPNWQSLNVKEMSTILLQKFQETHKLEYPSDISQQDDLAEYREIEYRIRRGRKSNPTPKSAAIVGKESDEDDEDEREEQDETTQETSQERPPSVDLGTGSAGEKEEREVEDSEPEASNRGQSRRRLHTRPRGKRARAEDLEHDDSDNQSSDTNASQVSSIPAR